MAQRIVRTASEGVTDMHKLMCAVVDEGRVPAARPQKASLMNSYTAAVSWEEAADL
jgi:hypothetical protein